ncbi:serine protease, partial [Streptomyces sp. NPDC048845]
MRIKRTTPHGVARRTRLIAAAAGLAAAAAVSIPAGSASADTAAVFSAAQLTKASDAVLDADVAGTAWHVD